MGEKLPVLRKGDRGPNVTKLQQGLVNWGFLSDNDVDGGFGAGTESAVIKFQKSRPQDKIQYASAGLDADGIVGANTWAELLKIRVDDIEIVRGGASGGARLISKAQAEDVFNTTVEDSVLEDMNRCFQTFSINTPARMRHFLAQIAHESAGLQFLEELASGDDYEYRDDLGNTEPGDGPRFKGAGAIQLTGRANYRRFADYIGDEKVMEGVSYVAAVYPITSAGFWWHDNEMNSLCDRGATVEDITLRVNGGYNGLEDREHYYRRALAVFPE